MSSEDPFQSLLGFVTRLESAKIPYRIEHNTTYALMVLFAAPGERWEVEFFSDGNIEVEVFGPGQEMLSGQEALDAIERMFVEDAE